MRAAFWERMQALLGEEFAAFRAAYEEPQAHGLRANTLKIAPEELRARLPIPLEPVPWAPGGFYYPEGARPGLHPFHQAGLYYIQEPTAMYPAVALAPQPGERVLDLCAAPGGKSTHLAALMQNTGLLVANEVDRRRALVLVENLERCGVANALVLQEQPDRLARRFAGFFDRILVDAPCSGEGMFRKAPETAACWGPRSPAAHAAVQQRILEAALAMLRPGGHLVYSTCTFSPEENEQVILQLLRRHPEVEVADPPPAPGAEPGRPEWVPGAGPGEAAALRRARRFWPHKVRGEGHFVVLLRLRGGEGEAADQGEAAGRARRGRQGLEVPAAALDLLRQFCTQHLHHMPPGPFRLWGDQLFQVPPDLPDLEGLRVVRAGLFLGEVKKNRFEPAHALAMAMPAAWARQRLDLAAEDEAVRAFIRGEPLPAPGLEGWTLVTVAGFPLGWGKAAGGTLKNHFPKYLRLQSERSWVE